MGLFNLFKNNSKKKINQIILIDENLSEYDNWLNFLSNGGTQTEWEELKRKNNWKFKISETKKFEKYQNELRSVSDKYYDQMTNEIQPGWSLLYQSKDYTNEFAKKYEHI